MDGWQWLVKQGPSEKAVRHAARPSEVPLPSFPLFILITEPAESEKVDREGEGRGATSAVHGTSRKSMAVIYYIRSRRRRRRPPS